MGATIWKGVLPQTTEDIQKNKSHILWHGSQKSFPLMKTAEKNCMGTEGQKNLLFGHYELPNKESTITRPLVKHLVESSGVQHQI